MRYLQVERCTLGQACTLTLAGGTGLSATNKIRIMDTSVGCGTAGAGSSLPTGLTGTVQNELQRAAGSAAEYAVGTVLDGNPVTASLPLCWANSHTSNADFSFKVTDLELNGPRADGAAQYDCTWGKACVVTLVGARLESTNKLRLIETTDDCGTTDGTTVSITGTGWDAERSPDASPWEEYTQAPQPTPF